MAFYKCENCGGVYTEDLEFDACHCKGPKSFEIEVDIVKYETEKGGEKIGFKEETDDKGLVTNVLGEPFDINGRIKKVYSDGSEVETSDLFQRED